MPKAGRWNDRRKMLGTGFLASYNEIFKVHMAGKGIGIKMGR